MDIDIVIPVHNALDYLKNLLADISSTIPKQWVKKAVFVNDKSNDETTLYLRSLVSDSTSVIETSKQLWFTRACNTGLRQTTASHILLMNTDMELRQGWLEEMFTVMQETNSVLVGSLYAPVHALGVTDRYKITTKPEYVTGHCWLLKRECLDKVGYLDEIKESNIHINSDKEYCWTLNEHGYNTAISYQSEVIHFGHKSWAADVRALSKVKLKDVT